MSTKKIQAVVEGTKGTKSGQQRRINREEESGMWNPSRKIFKTKEEELTTPR